MATHVETRAPGAKLRVLCTGGGGAGTEALERLWRDRYELHFADADVAAITPAVPEGRRHAIPMAGEGWAVAVADLCRTLAIDVLVPGVDEELSQVPELLRKQPGLLPLLPAPDFVRLMKDKLDSMVALRAAGVDAPRTVPLSRASEIGFPCLVKPRDGRGSRGVQVLHSPEEVQAYQTLARRPVESLIAQELLGGREWTVYVCADREGRLRSVVPVRVDVKRGITVRAETAAHPGIVAYCRAIHERFPTPGPFNVQLMETASGRLAAFEINPRVSTTLCLAVAAGADPIAEFMTSGPQDALRTFTSGMRLHRYWLNHIEQSRQA
jgi:carbamoyl-phosphate synthase large subunit